MPIADLDYREYFDEEGINHLTEEFEKADINGDGRINEVELLHLLKRMGRTHVGKHQLREMIRTVDINNTGTIEFEELGVLEIMMYNLRPRPELIDYRDYLLECDIKLIESIFVQLDTDRQGAIPLERMGELLDAMKCKILPDKLSVLLEQADTRYDGMLEFPMVCAVYAAAARVRKKCNYREFLTKDQVASFRKLFHGCDTQGVGGISSSQIESILRRLGMQVKKTQMQILMRDFDSDRSGDINFEEFCVMLLRLKGLRRKEVISPATRSCVQLWTEEQFSIKELLASGFTVHDFKNAGIPVAQLMKEGALHPLDLRRAGYSPAELRKGGLGAEELRSSGFSLGDLRNAGFSDSVLKHTNQRLQGCFSAGDLSILPQRKPQGILANAGAAQLARRISNASATNLSNNIATNNANNNASNANNKSNSRSDAATANGLGVGRAETGPVVFKAGSQVVGLPPHHISGPRPMTQQIREHTDWTPLLSLRRHQPQHCEPLNLEGID